MIRDPTVWKSFCQYNREGVVRVKTANWKFPVYTDSFFPLNAEGFFFLLYFDNIKWYSPIKSFFLSSDKWIRTVVIWETVTVYMKVISHRIRSENRKAQIRQDWNQEKVLDKAFTYFTVCWLLLKGKSSGCTSIALTKSSLLYNWLRKRQDPESSSGRTKLNRLN